MSNLRQIWCWKNFILVSILVNMGVLRVQSSDNSLLAALKVISDKIEETPSSVVYLNPGDGQPEDIGYGYQKNLRNLENVFDQASSSNQISKGEMVEKVLNYLSREKSNNKPKQLNKKSIFREREDSADVPENLQQLKYERFTIPSAFRERYKESLNNLQDNTDANNMEDQDNYLYTLNSLLNKYLEENVQDLSDEDLENFVRSNYDEKRDAPDEYRSLYDPNYSKLGRSVEKQFLFIPRYPSRKNKHHINKWLKVKPRITKRSKKNIALNDTHTDPKIEAELTNIFLGSGQQNNETITQVPTGISTVKVLNATIINLDKFNEANSKIDVKKKSIDWSNYFGFDRKKKSVRNMPDNDAILTQYMQAYVNENDPSSQVNPIKHTFEKGRQIKDRLLETPYQEKEWPLKEDKLMWLEDALIDDTLKYTGANQEKYNENQNGVILAENRTQPIESLENMAQQLDVEPKECSQLLQITQDCLEIGGSAGDLLLPLCTLYRVCRSCESENSDCEERFILGSHELCSKAPLCRYFSRRILQLMQDHPMQMECHKCMVDFIQNK
ncbi:uncharacterized protein LOC126904671 isoform X2 [Daktulosphaira vitifoliae]|uniref:uncharacterized protein LOC126904671 isoform X2 n=1 Tax=Daktulosphaira vitifoliae TaxID=58002 RepID=UPI0021A9E15F|nr:uncharacterized protein LOC126904671 isoform X2 [Daktulosphaira vitifoliae]